jgi:Fic family protein
MADRFHMIFQRLLINGNAFQNKRGFTQSKGITLDCIGVISVFHHKLVLKALKFSSGHRDAFLYIQELVQKQVNFSEGVIKQIHTLVLMDRPEDRGIYRRIPVRIMGAFHEPPDPILVPELMEKLVAEFDNKKLHPIQNAALFHLKFEGIHPFVDGNGRTGRLILNLFLMQNGYPPVNVKFADRRRYYDCFDSFYRDGNASPMIEMVAEYVEERLRWYLNHMVEHR